MGLDISHYKIITNLPEPKDHLNQGCFYEEDFKLFKDIKPIEHQIQEILYCKIINSFEIIKETKDFDDMVKRNKFNSANNYPLRNFTMIRDEDERNEKIVEFERINNLTGYHKYIKKGKWQTIQYYEINSKHGFYYAESGYQRKGMNDNFWKHFNPVSDIYCYANKEDFENAFNCVDKYWESDTNEIVQKRKEDFKRNFIDNYKLGESYLALSY